MFSVTTWKCSWPLIATITSLLALVSVVHMFLYPLVPSSFDYFSILEALNSCSAINESIGGGGEQMVGNLQLGLDLDVRFPPDSHRVVSYRGAPWRAEIGRWFSYCDLIATPINVIERIGGKGCTNNCSDQGICNHKLASSNVFRTKITIKS